MPRRILFAIGTETYTDNEYDDRDMVPDILGGIVDLLTPLGFETRFAPSGYLLDPGRNVFREAIRRARAEGEIVVIYYTGHGDDIKHEGYHLITTDFDKASLPDTGVKVVDVPPLIANRTDTGDLHPEQALTLIILDCCFSGGGALEVLQDALLTQRKNPVHTNLWIWATAGDRQWAGAGLFTKSLAQALTDTTVGASPREIPLLTLLGKVNTGLERSQANQTSELFPPNGRLTGNPPFFPNPGFMPDVAGLTVDAQHWTSKARGTDSPAATGFYLAGRTGRLRAATDLAQWITDPDETELAVVTGSPGTGKSSLLALMTLLADDATRDNLLRHTTTTSLVHQAAQSLPGATDIVAIHARGLNADQIGARIATDLELDAHGAHSLLELLRNNASPPGRIVLVDAVDEATKPHSVRDDLLLPLTQCGVRVVFGARRHVLPPPDMPAMTLDLDTAAYHDPAALTDYISHLLAATHEPDTDSPYALGHPDTVAVASAIADRATDHRVESFLVARVIAHALRARPERVDPSTAHWTELLPNGLSDAFKEDLDRFGARAPTMRALLEALAWARGPGLPWEMIWVQIARTLAGLRNEDAHLHTSVGDAPISDDDVRTLLNDAGAFIIEDLGPGGRSVFRPFHEELSRYLRLSATAPTESGNAEAGTKDIEYEITRALVRTVPTDSTDARRWDRAHPYVSTYLAQHAYAGPAGTLDDLIRDGGFLATADPMTLTPLLIDATPASTEIVRVYRRARPLLGDDPTANLAYVLESAAAVGALSLINPAGFAPLYRTLWSNISTDDSVLTIIAHSGPVRALAVIATSTGDPLLASAGDDGTIRLWNPHTGTPHGHPLTGHTGPVRALTVTTSCTGDPLLASAGDDGTIRLWNPHTGTPHGTPLVGHTGPVRALTTITCTGETLLASGGADRTIRFWNPHTGTARGKPLTGHDDKVSALAVTTTDTGEPLLASASADLTIRLWNPYTGTPHGHPLTGHTGWVSALAAIGDSTGEPLLASAGKDGTIRLWNPRTGTAHGHPLTGHDGPVSALAVTTTSTGDTLLASAGTDRTIRLWNPHTGTIVEVLRRRIAPATLLGNGSRLVIGDSEGLTTIELN